MHLGLTAHEADLRVAWKSLPTTLNRALLRRHDEIIRQAAEDFAGDLGGDDLAELAGLLAVAAERDVAAFADHQLVVAGAVVVLLGRVAAELDRAAVGVRFDDTDRLQQVGELFGE